MPFKGPSRACFACKAKKVKVRLDSYNVFLPSNAPFSAVADKKSDWEMQCDETNPNPCQKCLKSGVTCVYRPESDLVFRDMTSISETKVRRRVKARIAEREVSPGTSASSSSMGSVISTTQRTTRHAGDRQSRICSPMSTVWREVALPRFFADFIFESTLFTGSGLSFLPELYGRTNLHAPLKEALNAVAWLSMSNQLGIESLKFEACRSYFHAMELMAKLLQSSNEARQDATLATNYLFGLFEVELSSSFTVESLLILVPLIVCTQIPRAFDS
jgi:hypothetical protein